jgi:hypothetical protein
VTARRATPHRAATSNLHEVREAESIRVRVPIGKEPHEAFEKGAFIRYRGRTWLVRKISIASPPARCTVELLATPPQEGSEVMDWDPDA